MTLGEGKIEALQHINEKTIKGVDIPVTDGNYLDLTKTMNPVANTAQMQLAKINKLPKVYTISQNPITGLLQSFDEVIHYPGTDLSYTGTGAKSFSIEVDGTCAIYFYETISGVLTAINGTYCNPGDTVETAFTGSISVSETAFENYRGNLTISSATNVITMKIVATYPMKSRYRGLFAYAYATALAVPRLSAYIPYDLPSNCLKFNKMMRSYDQRQFKENTDYITTPDRKIHINWYLTGQFDIHYWGRPTEITNSTLDTYEFEVDTDVQSFIPWLMGGYAIMPTNPSLGTQLVNQYYALIQDSIDTEETDIKTLQATWG